MPVLRELATDDPRLAALLADSDRRLQALAAEAEARAGDFYERRLGRRLSIEQAIAEVFAAVEREGDAAVCRYAEAFDGVALSPERLRVGEAEIAAARARLPEALRAAIDLAIARVAAYQRRLLPQGFGERLDEPLGARWTPVDAAGAYVPGGAAGALPLFSSVYMNLVPAKVAGVPRTVLATPSRRDGSIADAVLATAAAIGVDEVYRVGGIPAIAMLAIGTARCPRVETLVGPGNIVVTLAKRQAYGRVQLDMLAGPSEVVVIADASADPRWVAADLLSQAEHDPLALCGLLALDGALADAVQETLAAQLAALPEERRRVAGESLTRFGFLVRCRTAEDAARLVDALAPEHLELLVAEPRDLLARIRHAGAIFVGPWSPEPIGDYLAGPSHTLPTGGGARRWSGLGPECFLKRTSIVNLDAEAFRSLVEAAELLARAEGLEAHARALAIRRQPRA
ncbi:MAG: histidinol dehydrogenase [Planctomycetota bacterium]|nr:histidinol dehydrogenase [Planctomycetota bacterium]MCX8039772.1 histidinol dehydrogenase [Planctomycetota bacterium]MDW8373152.1 histidinol dehydrogenase [Planctomycetota bacterium]